VNTLGIAGMVGVTVGLLDFSWDRRLKGCCDLNHGGKVRSYCRPESRAHGGTASAS
jgi:hypothetical protein